jgi:hypothetical protein
VSIARCNDGRAFRIERIRREHPQRSTPQSFTEGQAALLAGIFRRVRMTPELRTLTEHKDYAGLSAKVFSVERRSAALHSKRTGSSDGE